VQSLDLNAESHAEKNPREVGLPWSLLLIPVLLFAGALSVPVTLVGRRIQRRRELAFFNLMQSRARVMESASFRQAIAENRGTLVKERYSLKGLVRWWWTPENVYELCPHPMVDWMTMANEPGYRPTMEWFRRRYTDPDAGRAFLVTTRDLAPEEKRSLRSQLESESGTVRWIEIVPPARLRNHS
jgi:hypothetical protein